jgi:RNA polymerase sigma factor (sigma-70 family)
MYYSSLYVYGLKFTTDATLVEDCIQEIFTSFWLNRQKLFTVRILHSYLFVSFRNRLFKNIQRSNQVSSIQVYKDGYTFGLQLSADRIMINAEEMYEQSIGLHEAIDKLTARQKEAIYLKFYLDLSYDEIALMLGISVKATYKLFARAICELRQTYQKKMSSLTLGLSILVNSLALLSQLF